MAQGNINIRENTNDMLVPDEGTVELFAKTIDNQLFFFIRLSDGTFRQVFKTSSTEVEFNDPQP